MPAPQRIRGGAPVVPPSALPRRSAGTPRANDMAPTESAPTGAATALDYQSGRAVRRRRRRNRVLGAVVVAALVALGAWQGPRVYRAAERAYWARQVAGYRALPDQVVYEEDPARWPALLGRPGYFRTGVQQAEFSPAVGHTPPAVT